MSTAFSTAAASPAPGHVPVLTALQPNLPVQPATLFISKAVLRNERHERLTWEAGQAGIAAGITRALLQGMLPPQAKQDWNAEDAEPVYANNKLAAYTAVRRALKSDWPGRGELAEALALVGNPFFTPAQPKSILSSP